MDEEKVKNLLSKIYTKEDLIDLLLKMMQLKNNCIDLKEVIMYDLSIKHIKMLDTHTQELKKEEDVYKRFMLIKQQEKTEQIFQKRYDELRSKLYEG